MSKEAKKERKKERKRERKKERKKERNQASRAGTVRDGKGRESNSRMNGHLREWEAYKNKVMWMIRYRGFPSIFYKCQI
jgi:hypothetical protein